MHDQENTDADALSRHPLLPAPPEVQVARVFTHVEEGQEDSLMMEAGEKDCLSGASPARV